MCTLTGGWAHKTIQLNGSHLVFDGRHTKKTVKITAVQDCAIRGTPDHLDVNETLSTLRPPSYVLEVPSS